MQKRKSLLTQVKIIFGITAGIFLFAALCFPDDLQSSVNSLNEISTTLDQNPPVYPEPEVRRTTILDLDEILQVNSATTDPDVYNFLSSRLISASRSIVNTQVMSGTKIWQLYNMGFVVKSPTATICFDLIRIPQQVKYPPSLEDLAAMNAIINECDVLFISHFHADHVDPWVIREFLAQGKPVVTPEEMEVWESYDFYPYLTHLSRDMMHEKQTLAIQNGGNILDVVVYPGHQGPDVINNIYFVFMPNGISIGHTGDQSFAGINEDLRWFARIKHYNSLDILIIKRDGLQYVLGGINPGLVIPGHINELTHTSPPRLSYAYIYSKLDSLGYPFVMMAWGESYDHFALNQYTINFDAQPPQGGSVTAELEGGGSVNSGDFINHGENVILTASSAVGHTFDGWSGDSTGETETITIKMTSVKTVTANYFISTLSYVDVSATGSNDGSSWENAYIDIQDALNNALSGQEVWVAEGTYKPSVENSCTGDERCKSFRMKNDAAIYGGFNGTEENRDERDWKSNVTILSGDLNGDDAPADPEDSRDDNTYHVFYHPPGTDLDNTAILDGFTITGGGTGDGSGRTAQGTGMYNYNSSPALTNCTFYGNTAGSDGGGMANTFYSYPTLTNCTFYENTAGSDGGGMANYDSSPTLTNCTFYENTAGSDGGGMFNTFYSSPILTNCTFYGNTAGSDGGGMANSYSSPTLTNCTFYENTADYDGGGMINYESFPTLTNCILWGDTASDGSEISNDVDSSPIVSYSDIQGGYAGNGNIGDVPAHDPLFVVSANGDFRLQPGSPCIDAGDNDAPNLPGTDFEGHARRIDTPFVIDTGNGTAPIVDMGVDEYLVNMRSNPLIAVDDGYTVDKGGTLIVDASGGVLENDSDPQDDPLTAILVDNVTHGSLTLNTDGSFTYVHNGIDTTSDSFTYKANDGSADSNIATVIITPLNTPPNAVDDTGTTNEDVAVVIDVLVNDNDPDTGDTLVVESVTQGASGSVT
ncbi:MAG: hypothetical protein GY864_04255, partial [Desulfobacterales bacterium]|nr:hypothetical protein [Desulfobacterales bacterium]